jgi:DNA-binding transcriptional LysR family regulator
VVLGWGRLLERPLSDGRLVRVGRAAVSPEETYGLVVPASARRAPSRDAFIRWIRSEMM